MFQQKIRKVINVVCDEINRSYFCRDNILGPQLLNRKGVPKGFSLDGFLSGS